MSITKLFSSYADKKSSRVGRGIAAGGGKTAGRGTKGQKSRAGAGRKISAWFEGGQTPLFRKTAKKRGFSRTSVKPLTITTAVINHFYTKGEVVSPTTLVDKKIIRPSAAKLPIKVVKKTPLTEGISFEGVAVSKSLQ